MNFDARNDLSLWFKQEAGTGFVAFLICLIAFCIFITYMPGPDIWTPYNQVIMYMVDVLVIVALIMYFLGSFMANGIAAWKVKQEELKPKWAV